MQIYLLLEDLRSDQGLNLYIWSKSTCCSHLLINKSSYQPLSAASVPNETNTVRSTEEEEWCSGLSSQRIGNLEVIGFYQSSWSIQSLLESDVSPSVWSKLLEWSSQSPAANIDRLQSEIFHFILILSLLVNNVRGLRRSGAVSTLTVCVAVVPAGSLRLCNRTLSCQQQQADWQVGNVPAQRFIFKSPPVWKWREKAAEPAGTWDNCHWQPNPIGFDLQPRFTDLHGKLRFSKRF